MKITVRLEQEACVQQEEIGRAIIGMVADQLGIGDDAGMDWLTYDGNNTYIGGFDWHVSSDERVSILVDAANILINKTPLKLVPEMIPGDPHGPTNQD